MKLSAVLITAASLPIATQTQAHAADGPTSDKISWVKANLSMAQSPKEDKAAKQLKMNINKTTLQPMKATAAPLRPFVPNRKLPSARELELSQSSRMMSPQDNGSLSGQVSEFSSTPIPTGAPQYSMAQPMPYSAPGAPQIATYDSGYSQSVMPRMMPGQVPTLPGQIRVNRARKPRLQAQQPVLTLQQQFDQQRLNMQQAAPRQMQMMPMQQQQMQMPMANGFNQMQGFQQNSFAPPMSTPGSNFPQSMQMLDPQMQQQANAVANSGIPPAQQQAFMDHLVEQVHPATQNQSGNYDGMQIIRPPSEGGGAGPTAGPAPFPLSLLPQDSLKQFISAGAHQKTSAPPAYFGSWHGSKQNLPAAGFHSNMQSHGGFQAPVVSHAAPKHPLPQKQKPNSGSTQSIAQIRRLPPQEMHLAAYPPYVTSNANQNP